MATELQALATEYGTPLYVYSEAVILRQVRALRSALDGIHHLVCYAVKANSNLSLLRLFRELGLGFDIVSQGELMRVLAGGGDARSVVFSGVGKSAEEIEFALGKQIKQLNVESPAELQIVEEVARSLNVSARIALRINPDISVETHPYLATGLRTSKFGLPVSEAYALWDTIKRSPHLNLVGVDCHIGSQICDISPLRDAYGEVLRVACELKSRGANIQTLDVGGGLGVGFSGHYTPLDLAKFRAMISELASAQPFEWIWEPGKFLITEAGTLLAKVLCVKTNLGKKFVVLDAGMNDLIRPTLYEAFHHIEVLGPGEGRALETVDVVGPVCESGCFFARDRSLPAVRSGDIVAICDAGAYGMSMASHYNTRRLPAEVLVRENGETVLIRKRDIYEQLWENEIVK